MGIVIDSESLLDDFDKLRQIGLGDDGGQYREAYSQADMDGRTLVEGFMRDAGMSVKRDGALNSVGRYVGLDPSLPPIVIGSHTDTVPCGGNFDGVLGVLGGIAVVRALNKEGRRLNHPLEVINFSGEEAVSPGGTFGSRVMTGAFHDELLSQKLYSGESFGERLKALGVDLGQFRKIERKAGDVAAYVELHIEQGGILDEKDIPLGIVDGIVGFRRYRLSFPGAANHAGTTPMDSRDDALVKTAKFVLAVKKTAEKYGIVGTVGTLEVDPGAPNVIPGQCDITFEIRGLEDSILDQAEAELQDFSSGFDAGFEKYSHKPPVLSDESLVSAMKEGCREAGIEYRVMPSGAGHDANLMARICPIVMLFSPNKDGISHAKEEYCSPRACVNGATALLRGVLNIDKTIKS